MERKKTLSVFLIIAFFLLQIPITGAPPVDAWETKTVDEDLFHAAYLFDGIDMVYLQGQEMQIRGWYWLEGPVLDARRHVIEAYLSVRTPGIGSTDPNATMTIWGKPSAIGGTPSYYDDPSAINGPYTTNSYTVNISAFVGPGVWHNITVTNIIREINQGHYFWDGHDIAFVTLSPSDRDEERYISSEESGHAAILYVHYGEPATGAPGPGYVWVEDYRNLTLWRRDVYENATMPIYLVDQNNPEDYYYGEFGALIDDPTDTVYIDDNGNPIEESYRNTIAQINNTIVVMEDPAQVIMQVSTDSGATWTSHILNDQFTDLAAHASSASGTMWTDINGTTHILWRSYTDTSPAAYVAVYSNFTLYANGTLAYYDGFTEWAFAGQWQNIEVDQHGRVHIAYIISDVLYYLYRNSTDQWVGPETIRNTGDSLLECSLDVAVHSNATRPPVVRFVYQRQWVGNEYSEQAIRESDGTLTFTLMSSNNAFDSNSAMWFNGNTSIATYTDNPGGGSSEIEFRLFNFDIMTLGAVQYATPTTQAHHFAPDIGVDEGTNTLYFVWQNTFGTSAMYGRRYNLTSNTFNEGMQDLSSPIDSHRMSISPSSSGGVVYTDWIAVDTNGTVVFTDTFSTCLNVSCIEPVIDEDVFGYPDPQDPNPPGWDEPGEGLLTRFNFKLIIFMIGMILFAGTPVYGFAERPEGATWVVILFCMLIGVALLWSLETM